MAASSNPCIFSGSRGHLDESAKNNIELPRVSFAKALKIRGCYEEGRQLESLHFYRVPCPPRVMAKRAPQKGSKLKSFFEKLFWSFGVARGCPAEGRQPDSLHIDNAPCAGQINCIFTSGSAQSALPPSKYAVDLFCERPRARRSQYGTFSPPWRILGCPKSPQDKFLKIRGGHQDGRKLD